MPNLAHISPEATFLKALSINMWLYPFYCLIRSYTQKLQRAFSGSQIKHIQTCKTFSRQFESAPHLKEVIKHTKSVKKTTDFLSFRYFVYRSIIIYCYLTSNIQFT